MTNEADPNALAQAWLDQLAKHLSADDASAVAALFAPECWWRDFVAFTWTIATVEGRPAIRERAAATASGTRAGSFILDRPASRAGDTVEAWFRFETRLGRGIGQVRLVDGLARTLFTALRELKGFEERRGPTREAGTEHGAIRGRRTWADRRADDARLGLDRQPWCLIVGGGQGGLGLAARLKRLGVPTLIVDGSARPGDAWRRRYRSLCLHDPVWYDHMPYLPFPEHWPIYTPKDKMGDWLEAYASIMELDGWYATTCRSAAYDAGRGEWTVTVEREGRVLDLRPKHLVLATGLSGVPNEPDWPGMERFRGTLHHSSRHPGGAGFAGKRCVVVGANNSAHDIAADLWEHGAAVTMVQRSPTLVVRAESLQRHGRPLYSEEAVAAGIDADRADLIAASTPYALLPDLLKPVMRRIRDEDSAFYAALEKAGFLLTFGEDETGIGMMYPRRASGYYIDVGASGLIASGEIRLASGRGVSHLTEEAVVLDDGTVLPADLVVSATGYGPMTDWAARLISPEVAARVGPCWGIGSGTARDPGPWHGELRNMWTPTAQAGLWFHGGNLQQSRHFSRYLALQLKARYEGLPVGPPSPSEARA
ncbi:flavin-containing monooxygenase [Methylobacterium sp. SyP6R]|uniref:flavin-containing monooxygenase n=1 Tax=Methylobacterium sp. SyP6R TaxID=2718876 RepID=UPI001F2A1895|nr:NAD(P)/FAD-dependent oxidoreductase [Methylobacterium sp. SyP6R]MCF4129528.1 NAD(P)/FAD-dependent oxidoreductase [Methylobacterium sp. SyP6R]